MSRQVGMDSIADCPRIWRSVTADKMALIEPTKIIGNFHFWARLEAGVPRVEGQRFET